MISLYSFLHILLSDLSLVKSKACGHDIGDICLSEKDLLNWIKLAKDNLKFEYGPDLLLYHKKIDNNSCSNIAKLVLN